MINRARRWRSALLERDPVNLDARRAALDAAIQAQDWTRATSLVSDSLRATPDDPRAWMMSATLNRARKHQARAAPATGTGVEAAGNRLRAVGASSGPG
jgi:predicted Zn-dependent protease